MKHRAIASIMQITGLTFIGILVLFFFAEIAFAQDAFFVRPVFVLAGSSIAIVLWYWG